jgi:hypothetical protein
VYAEFFKKDPQGRTRILPAGANDELTIRTYSR